MGSSTRARSATFACARCGRAYADARCGANRAGNAAAKTGAKLIPRAGIATAETNTECRAGIAPADDDRGPGQVAGTNVFTACDAGGNCDAGA